MAEKYDLITLFKWLFLIGLIFNFPLGINQFLDVDWASLPLWEAVLPMDILPNELYRAIVANDLDLMEKLGILECDEEDLALCSFACPSKIDVGGMVRRGLNMIWDEGTK